MFLTDLTVNGHVAASTQNQAFCALLFLDQEVLGIQLPRLDALRARRPTRLPLPGQVSIGEPVHGLHPASLTARGVQPVATFRFGGSGIRQDSEILTSGEFSYREMKP
jgi:hypothetical protein